MTHHQTRPLAEYIAGATFEHIPDDVVEWIKLMILDSIGAGVLGDASV